jgi:hypothetical protein
LAAELGAIDDLVQRGNGAERRLVVDRPATTSARP